MTAIIAAIIPVAIQLLGWFLDKSKADKETKEAFLQWVKLAAKDIGSVKLMQYADTQLQWFKDNPQWKESP